MRALGRLIPGSLNVSFLSWSPTVLEVASADLPDRTRCREGPGKVCCLASGGVVMDAPRWRFHHEQHAASVVVDHLLTTAPAENLRRVP